MLSSIAICTRHYRLRSTSMAAEIFKTQMLTHYSFFARRAIATTVAGSSTTSSSTVTTATTTTSARKEFQSIPVEPTILKYINMIGVGRINLASYKLKRAQKRRRTTRRRVVGNVDSDDNVVSEEREKAFFENQQLHSRLRRMNGSKKKPTSFWLPPPPFGATLLSTDSMESGRIIKRLPVKVIGSAGSIDEAFPHSTSGLPEVALAGRSNVGKSTLLNALLYGNLPHRETGGPIERKRGRCTTPEGAKLPRGVKAVTSDRPGETRKITFYQLSAQVQKQQEGESKKLSLLLVDLPGYGFSYASEEAASSWSDLMKQYLVQRGKSLKRILLLIDARHGMKKADFDFLDSIQVALYSDSNGTLRKDLTPIQIILTKCDLVDRRDLARRVVQVRQQLSGALRREPSSLPVMLVSAKAGIGFNNVKGERARGGVLELQKELAALVPDNHKPKVPLVEKTKVKENERSKTRRGPMVRKRLGGSTQTDQQPRIPFARRSPKGSTVRNRGLIGTR